MSIALQNKWKQTWLGTILFNDARHLQIIYLSCFLTFGLASLGWQAELFRYALTFTACLITQAIGIHFTTKDFRGLKSAVITSLSLCLLLKAGSPLTVALAGVLAIGSKYIIRFKGKHIFNPANFGIIAAILLTGDAWVSPGQWGSSILLIYIIGATSLFLLFRVGRLDLSFAFLAVFGGLHFLRTVVFQGWSMDVFLHQMTNGTLLLFTFFMITDPISTPNAPKARLLWAALIGLLAFFLSIPVSNGGTAWSTVFYTHAAPIWALFILAPFTALFDRVFIHQKYKWTES